MSLINDYLKRLGSPESTTQPSKGRGMVPPALRRVQKESGETTTRKKKYLGFAAGMVVVVYSLGYLLVSVLSISFYPAVDESVAVEVADVPETKESPTVPEVTVTQSSGAPSSQVEAKKKIIEKEVKKDTVSAVEHPQPDRITTLKEHKNKRSKTVEQPYPLSETGHKTAETVISLDKEQVTAQRGIFKESRNSPVYFYQIALQAQHNNNFGQAERFYKKVLKQAPEHENALVNLAAIYIQEKRLQEAQSLLNSVIKLNPENPKALVNSGMIALQSNKRASASSFFLQALRYNPVEETALINLAYLALREKKYDEAGEYFEKLIRVSPDKTRILLAYAGLKEKKQDFNAAISLYRRSLDQLSMQKHPEQYEKIRQRILILRQYTAQRGAKPFEF